MTEINNENSNSQMEAINEVAFEETDTVDVLKEKIGKVNTTIKERNTKIAEIDTNNKQLFERTKKAEGFEKDEAGKWVKALKPETPQTPKPEVEKPLIKSKDLEFDVLAFYNTKSDALRVESPEDIEFVKKLKEETGKTTADLLSSSYFKAEYKSFKDKAVVDAATDVPTVDRSGNQVPPGKSLEYWITKNAGKGKGGWELPPEGSENAELTLKVINALTALNK